MISSAAEHSPGAGEKPERQRQFMLGSSLFSVECQAWYGAVLYVFTNPKGIESASPGLRGTSYPGCQDRKSQTLQGFHLLHNMLIFNPFRVFRLLIATQRKPSLNRANAGLKESIPLGLKNRPLHQVGRPDLLFHRKQRRTSCCH